MLSSKLDPREFKDSAYAAFAAVARAFASPRRLELLDLLVQGPLVVEQLAQGVGRPVASTSQHLQVLKRARVVATTRHGTRIEYRLAEGVALAFASLRSLAESRSLELSATKATFYGQSGAADVITAQDLSARMARDEVTLIDVRPEAEYAESHIEGAVSVPIEQLQGRLNELPPDSLLVATCRGPYCVFAADAVRILRASGREAVRFEPGVADWSLQGGATTERVP